MPLLNMNRQLNMNKSDNLSPLFKNHSILSSATVRDAMRVLNALSGDSMTLFVSDDNETLIGTVTDGDIRRSLIAGKELTDPVENVMNREFLYVSPKEDISLKIAKARKRKIELLPLIEDGKVVDIIDLRKIRTHIPIEAVLMAGGRGERLRPLTDDLPKPLLKVDGKPIIDYNIEELEACGIKKIHVTVNYLADKIKDHFKNRAGRATVDCVEEPKRLGTLGSLAYVENIESDDILIMNSDLLSSVDFESLFLHHRNIDADFTIAAVPYSVSVPFAIMRLEHGWVKSLEEKPTYNYFANGGVYIMKTNLIGRINKGKYLDAPDFIMELINDGFKVGCYHINGSWIDIGSPDDYRLACELMTRKNKL